MKKIIEMKTDELIEFIKNYIAEEKKISNDEIRYSYFELKVKMNMDGNDIDVFLKYSKKILEKLRL